MTTGRLSPSTEAVFEHAWAAGVLDPLPWAVLADKLQDDGWDAAAGRARALGAFDPAGLDWSSRVPTETVYTLPEGGDAPGDVAALLTVSLVARRFDARGAWGGGPVRRAVRVGCRRALALPVPPDEVRGACSEARGHGNKAVHRNSLRYWASLASADLAGADPPKAVYEASFVAARLGYPEVSPSGRSGNEYDRAVEESVISVALQALARTRALFGVGS